MWKTIWECFRTPIAAVFTGKYLGMPVSRNPISWLGIIFYGLLLIPITIFLYPIYLVLLWFGFRTYARSGNYAEILKEGIQVTDSKGNIVSQHNWEAIREVKMEFKAPCFYPMLKLKGGGLVHLHCANVKEIMKACSKYGIKVNEQIIKNGT